MNLKWNLYILLSLIGGCGIDAYVAENTDARSAKDIAAANAGVDSSFDVKNAAFITNEDEVLVGKLDIKSESLSNLKFEVSGGSSLGSVLFSEEGRFTYKPNKNMNGEDSVKVSITNGAAKKDVTLTVVINPVDDKPTANAAKIGLVEDHIYLQGHLSGSDPESTTLYYQIAKSATKGSISNLNSATGSYSYQPYTNAFGTDSFTFTVSDGALVSEEAKVDVTIAGENDEPTTIASSGLQVSEDVPYQGQLLAHDNDGDVLTFTKVAGPTPNEGVLVVQNDGKFTYTPIKNGQRSVSFSFKVSDPSGSFSTAATVQMNIVNVNDAPTANSIANFPVTEDFKQTGTVTGSDPDGGTVTFSVVDPPSKGNLTVFNTSNGNFEYTPAKDKNGNDSFSFRTFDGNSYSQPATVSVVIAAVNDKPTAEIASFPVQQDQSLTATLIANDVENTALVYSVVDGPIKGSFSSFNVNTGAFTYVPNSGEIGQDSFTFKVKETGTNGLESDPATVTISLNDINDRPVAVSGSFHVDEDAAKTGSVTATDPDVGATFTYRITDQVDHGSLTFSTSTGSYTYTPSANYNGSDSFKFQVSDGQLESLAEGLIQITVDPKNDKPIANPYGSVIQVAEDRPTPLPFTLTKTDPDVGETYTFSIVNSAARGLVRVTNAATGAFDYKPYENDFGTDSFTFKVNDGHVDSDPVTVNILIIASNDKPRVSDITFEVNQGEEITYSVIASDVDNPTLTITYGSAGKGSITPIAGSPLSFKYKANASQSGPDTFTFTASDGQLTSDPATAHVTIKVVDHAPIANDSNFELNEEEAVSRQVTAQDENTATLVYELVTSPVKGNFVFNANGSYSYTGKVDITGTDQFTFKAKDAGGQYSGIGMVSVKINALNDAPTAGPMSGITISSKDSLTVLNQNLVGADVDSAALTFSVVEQPVSGKLVLVDATAGKFNYTLKDLSVSSDSFSYKVSDGGQDSNTVTVNIQYTGPKAISQANWNSLPTSTPANRRFNGVGIWTGTAFLHWGGEILSGNNNDYSNTGAKIGPEGASWTTLATTNSASNRRFFSAAWTGSEMLVTHGMGAGNGSAGLKGTAKKWLPNNAWVDIAAPNTKRFLHTYAYSDGKFMVFGGSSENPDVAVNANSAGEVYYTADNKWKTMAAAPAAMGPRIYHSGIWNGSEMVIWGGADKIVGGTIVDTGYAFTPSASFAAQGTGTWSALPTLNAPSARKNHTAIWTGDRMIIWGGEDKDAQDLGDGGILMNGVWKPINTVGAPSAILRSHHVAYYIDGPVKQMVIWGGRHRVGTDVSYPNDICIYQIDSDFWKCLASDKISGTALSGRSNFGSVWTGENTDASLENLLIISSGAAATPDFDPPSTITPLSDAAYLKFQ